MKKRIMLILFAVLLVFTLVGTPVLAKEPNEGASGVPFQELWDAIDDAVSAMEQLVDVAILALQEQIDAETTARQAADQQLQVNIDGEETARIAADGAEATA